jgi:hypothetical protein
MSSRDLKQISSKKHSILSSRYSDWLRTRRLRSRSSSSGRRKIILPRMSSGTGSRAHIASYPMGTGGSFPEIKRPGREADHSPPASAEVKNM